MPAANKLILVVVSGLPGTGKTTLARGLGRELGLPVIGRDGFKEILFDGLGWGEREWSRKLGVVSYGLLYYATRAMLSGGASLIAESNFHPLQAAPELTGIAHETGARLAQVFCRTDDGVLLERYMARAGSPERHPGHVDLLGATEMAERLQQWEFKLPVALDAPLVVVDTTDFANADPCRVAAELGALLG